MSNLQYDVVIVGGGPVGLATAYQCAKAGKSVLLLEQFNLFNQSGSSNDLVRLFRTIYTEDFMADLAYQSL
jgi:sarcosine oxidase/L-pipecolate oxidase